MIKVKEDILLRKPVQFHVQVFCNKYLYSLKNPLPQLSLIFFFPAAT